MVHRLESEYDLVLEGSEETTLEIARQFLEEAGIPTLVDREQLSLGALGYASGFTNPRLFVPKGLGARAELVLRELRGQSRELDRLVQRGEVPGPAPLEEAEPGGARIPRQTLLLIVAIALVLAAYLAWRALQS